MNKIPSSKLLQLAEEEEGQSISAGPLTLGDVVYAAALLEAREQEAHRTPVPKLPDTSITTVTHSTSDAHPTH